MEWNKMECKKERRLCTYYEIEEKPLRNKKLVLYNYSYLNYSYWFSIIILILSSL